LIIHRIIKESLYGVVDDSRFKELEKAVDAAAIQSSDMERLATEAEREVDDLKKAEYMSERIGEEYEGIISSVTNFGMFVELRNTVEGLVHISNMDDDYYIYDEDHLCLIGERTKNKYRLGDEVKIKVAKVDMGSYEIYFDLVKEEIKKETEEGEEALDIIQKTTFVKLTEEEIERAIKEEHLTDEIKTYI
jgi:ribonuclease R